jgi:hypothetical protein
MWEMYAKGEDTDGDSAADRDMEDALAARDAKAAKAAAEAQATTVCCAPETPPAATKAAPSCGCS